MITSNAVRLGNFPTNPLEQVHDADHKGARIGADGNRVRVDVERVRGAILIADLDIARLQQGPRRQAVDVADFPQIGTGVGTMAQLTNFFRIGGTALAVAGAAIVKHELAAAERNL